MTDFLITMMTLYPWFTWLMVVLAAAGLGYVAVWVAGLTDAAWNWVGYRRAVWASKTAVRRQLMTDPMRDCAVCRDRDAMILEAMAAGDDPPEYQHPDGDDDGLGECPHGFIVRTCAYCGPDWDGPPDDWSPAEEWGEKPWRSLGTLAEIAAALAAMNDDDQLPDGPPQPWEGYGASGLERCANRDCYRYGEPHPGACDVAPTMPAACYPDGRIGGLAAPDRPAGPPVPWSGLAASLETLARGEGDPVLSGRVADELGHTTVEAAVDSMFTRAQAREVQAMITDGVIPGGQEKQ